MPTCTLDGDDTSVSRTIQPSTRFEAEALAIAITQTVLAYDFLHGIAGGSLSLELAVLRRLKEREEARLKAGRVTTGG